MNNLYPAMTKAVFPVAGLGTRFLPATKASPKEMMPIIDKPLIQYAVEEAMQAGIKELIFITSNNKRPIEDHFDNHYELEQKLKISEKHELLNSIKEIVPKEVTCIYIRQPESLGLGHAVLCAKPVVKQEPFAVLLADDLMQWQSTSPLSAMIKSFNETQASILAVEPIKPHQSKQYGIIAPQKDFSSFGPIQAIVEKPEPENAPSSFGVIGRYILTPGIFNYLENLQAGKNNEIQLTDAIQGLLQKEAVYATTLNAKRFDCGDKLGYLKAVIEFGLQHPELGEDFKNYLRTNANTFIE